jgi:hypothetical protein
MTVARTIHDENDAIDTKAIRILLSARDVAEEIDRLRHALSARRPDPSRAVLLDRELEDAVGRLCNLISLAVAEVELTVSEGGRERFNALLNDVRQRWRAFNLDRLSDRVAAIGAQVSEAMATKTYRLGLADRLGRACAEIIEILRAMGAQDLPGLETDRLAAILDDIRALSSIEAERFRFHDFDRR